MTDAPIFWHGCGLDSAGQMWLLGDDGVTAYKHRDHPLAHESGFRAFAWLINMGQVWEQLTPAQRRALADPGRPGIRCLPKLRALGLIEGTQRTNMGELLVRWARMVKRPEVLAEVGVVVL